MIRRRTLLPALLLAGCAPEAARLAGGQPEEGGIGGTGLRASASPPDDGIGGTGVFGAVTALGSVRVNGLRLATWSGTATESLLRGAAPIQPGDTIAAEAVRTGEGLLASRIAVFHPLLGPAEIDADHRLRVLGTPVLLPAGTVLRDLRGRPHALAALRSGQMLAVSGLWQGDRVVATSLLALEGPVRGVLRGQLRQAGDGFVVGGTRLRASDLPAGLAPERFVTVQGRPTEAGFAVEGLATAPLGVFAGRVGALAVEGFVAPNRGGPGFHLSGFGLPLAAAGSLPPPGQRHLMLGRDAAGFRVEAGIALPDAAPARAAALRDAGAEAAIGRWLARG